MGGVSAICEIAGSVGLVRPASKSDAVWKNFMNTRCACWVVLGLVALTGTNAMAQRRGPRGGDQQEARRAGWIHSLDEGVAEARKSGKPLMVVIRCVP